MNAPNYTIRRAAQYAVAHPAVAAVDVLNAETPHEQTVVEIVVTPETTTARNHVPPSLLAILGEKGLGIVDVTRRGEPPHYVITAT